MRVLIGCEFSGRVRDAFITKGHHALSCDFLPSEQPGPHYQGDIRDILFDGWDMLIVFPPCRYLCYAGSVHWSKWEKEQKEALEFVRFLLSVDIPRIVLENPMGIISKVVRWHDQVIHPWMFLEPWHKPTCLWLKNVPPLMATCVSVERKGFVDNAPSRGEKRRMYRSRTFQGVALAMAEQWGNL